MTKVKVNSNSSGLIINNGANEFLNTANYTNELIFDVDKDIYHNATGQSLTFTLGTGNKNGVGIFLRLNKPISVTFPTSFEADTGTIALDATKLNVFLLIFFTDWNGTGSDHVIYKNSTFNAL